MVDGKLAKAGPKPISGKPSRARFTLGSTSGNTQPLVVRVAISGTGIDGGSREFEERNSALGF